jgi:RinA family phage transcriptional activator
LAYKSESKRKERADDTALKPFTGVEVVMAIRREIKAYIEAELRDYNDTLRAIGDDRNELLQQSPVHDNIGGSSYDIGNPTQAQAIKLMTNKRIRRMEQTCKAIETVIEALPEEKYRLVELKYWTRPQTLTDEGIAREINIDRRTLYRWADAIILAIGIEMGLANEVCQKDVTFKGA